MHRSNMLKIWHMCANTPVCAAWPLHVQDDIRAYWLDSSTVYTAMVLPSAVLLCAIDDTAVLEFLTRFPVICGASKPGVLNSVACVMAMHRPPKQTKSLIQIVLGPWLQATWGAGRRSLTLCDQPLTSCYVFGKFFATYGQLTNELRRQSAKDAAKLRDEEGESIYNKRMLIIKVLKAERRSTDLQGQLLEAQRHPLVVQELDKQEWLEFAQQPPCPLRKCLLTEESKGGNSINVYAGYAEPPDADTNKDEFSWVGRTPTWAVSLLW